MAEAGSNDTGVHVLDFNGNLRTARSTPTGLEFSYDSHARAIAILDFVPKRMEIDGVETKPGLLLPRGQHLITIDPE